MVGGFFPEDTRPWEGMFEALRRRCCLENADHGVLGAIITSYCSEFEDLDGHGHGVKLETMNMTVSNSRLGSRSFCPNVLVFLLF